MTVAYSIYSMIRQAAQALPAQTSPVAETPMAAKPVAPETAYASVRELGEQMARPHGLTSVDLVNFLQERIRTLDPQLCSVIELNPDALEAARELDRERANGRCVARCMAFPFCSRTPSKLLACKPAQVRSGLWGRLPARMLLLSITSSSKVR